MENPAVDDPDGLYVMKGRAVDVTRIIRSRPPSFPLPGSKRRKRPYSALLPPFKPNPRMSMSFGEKFLKQSGWDGSGLGRSGTGIAEPISLEAQSSSAGLGYTDTTKKRVEAKIHEVDAKRKLELEQKPEYIPVNDAFRQIQLLMEGMVLKTMDSQQYREDMDYWYSHYCNSKLVKDLFARKSVFDGVERTKFLDARRRSNPYETLGKHIFMNRAAMKMANLDYMFNFQISQALKGGIGYLRFADICSGPGGFTEYIYWRRKRTASGFGLTLRGNDDFKMHSFNKDAPHENFMRIYGPDNSGNIYKKENMNDFVERVLANTNGEGVDLCMGDGGSEVVEHNLQEEYMKRLVLCQFLVGLRILKVGKCVFVCKVFDTFLPFTVSLIYFLYYSFERITIVKPFTSREANSERYVICFNLLKRPTEIISHLTAANDLMEEHENQKISLVELLKSEFLLANRHFVDYIKKSNTTLLERQVLALENLLKYIEDEYLLPLDERESTRKELVLRWRLPSVESISRNVSILYDAANIPVSVRDAPNFNAPKHHTKGFYGDFKEMDRNSKVYQLRISQEVLATRGEIYTLSRSGKIAVPETNKEGNDKVSSSSLEPKNSLSPENVDGMLKVSKRDAALASPRTESQVSTSEVKNRARISDINAASNRRRRMRTKTKAKEGGEGFNLDPEKLKLIEMISSKKE